MTASFKRHVHQVQLKNAHYNQLKNERRQRLHVSKKHWTSSSAEMCNKQKTQRLREDHASQPPQHQECKGGTVFERKHLTCTVWSCQQCSWQLNPKTKLARFIADLVHLKACTVSSRNTLETFLLVETVRTVFILVSANFE